MPGVRQWGKSFFVYNSGDDDRETTHLCLDGGKLCVPFKNVPYFHTKLGADIAKGVRNYIVERRTPVFRFHVDLDIFEPKVKCFDEIVDWIKDGMLNVLRQFYPNLIETDFKQLTVFVCTTEAKHNVEKHGTVYDKVGVHLLFPDLLVNTEIAMILRSAFIQYFKGAYGLRETGYNEWADVFDKTVYVSNGLRMVGCGKMEPCKTCKGRYNNDGLCEGNSSGGCGGKGKYDVGRVYSIEIVLDGNGNENQELLEELLEDEILMTNRCSIRCDPEHISEKDMPQQTYPDWFDKTLELNPIKKPGSSKIVTVKEGSFKSFSSCLKGSRARLADKDKRVQKIKEWIKNDEIHDLFRIPKKYRNSAVQDVIMCTPSVTDRYYIINVDSRWCLNLQDEHKNNGVYFIVNDQGLFQKCFCRCATTDGRISGQTCEQFTSECFQLPDDLDPILFSYSDDYKKSNYIDFVKRCESSLTNIQDEKQLLTALFDRMLGC